MRFLLCTDGSSHGQRALRYGASLARASSQPATLLGVVEHPEDRSRLEEALREARQWLAGAPPPETKVRAGHAAGEILDEARGGEYDLLVVGAHGRRGLTRLLLGSTSERIARQAKVPVLIVRGQRTGLRRMLVCSSGSEPGLGVVAFAGRLARLADAEVTVLHVMSQIAASPLLPHDGGVHIMPQAPDAPEADEFQLQDLEADAQELMARGTPEGRHLRRALEILDDLGVSARVHVRHGLVVDEILEAACEGDYDLVVIGAHVTERGWMRWMVQDMGREIMGICRDRPILLVRPTASS